MPAAACLRVRADRVDENQRAGLADVVAKLTNAFLETRWAWPRRHGRVGLSAFLLADPRAQQFDAEELCALARQLQVKLFGDEDAGEVNLLLFEGVGEAISRFATCDADALEAALAGGGETPPLTGRIRRITGSGVEPVAHRGDPEALDSEAEAAIAATVEELVQRVQDAVDSAKAEESETAPAAGFHAVYFTARQNIIGSAISDGRLGASSLRGVFGNAGHIQGEQARQYDANCLEAALPLLDRPFGGLLFFPVSFSAIVHRPTRELYAPLLGQLPAKRRGQLAASVYDVPRDPSFTALSQLKAFLNQYFGFIDLCVTDPGFGVEKLSVGMVNSVTLVVTEADPKARLACIRRFMDNRETYKRQKVWPAVSHIRTKAELDFCLAQQAHFLSGPAVSDLLDSPSEAGQVTTDALPLRREGASTPAAPERAA